jgi:hypothetical protein
LENRDSAENGNGAGGAGTDGVVAEAVDTVGGGNGPKNGQKLVGDKSTKTLEHSPVNNGAGKEVGIAGIDTGGPAPILGVVAFAGGGVGRARELFTLVAGDSCGAPGG